VWLRQFLEELPNGQLQWIEECGHVPHLEKPEETAAVIASFLTSTEVGTSTKKSNKAKDEITAEQGNAPTYYIGGGVLGALILEELIKQFF